MALNEHPGGASIKLNCPSNVVASDVPYMIPIESIGSSSLWKRRNKSKCSKVGEVTAGKYPCTKPNISAAEFPGKSCTGQRLQRLTRFRSSSSVLPTKLHVLSGVNADLVDEQKCAFMEPPLSAPPEITSVLYAWHSPNTPPLGAEFYEWTNGTARKSTSPCQKTATPQTRANEISPTSGNEDVWPRKPPFHLPPLDPSVFENKSKGSKHKNSKGSRRRQKDHGEKESIAEALSTSSHPKKLAEKDKSGANSVDSFSPETTQQYKTEEEADSSDQKLPPATKIAPFSSVRRSEESLTIDTNLQTLPKSQSISRGRTKSRALRYSSSFRTTDPYSSQTIPSSPGSQSLVGFMENVSQLTVVRRLSSSQPDLSQLRSCQVLTRVRRVGVCRETENIASINERMKARVLIKKFGELNIF